MACIGMACIGTGPRDVPEAVDRATNIVMASVKFGMNSYGVPVGLSRGTCAVGGRSTICVLVAEDPFRGTLDTVASRAQRPSAIKPGI